MRRRRAVVIVGIVLLAGCAGTLGGNTPVSEAPPETDTATEAATTESNAAESLGIDSLSATNATIVEGARCRLRQRSTPERLLTR